MAAIASLWLVGAWFLVMCHLLVWRHNVAKSRHCWTAVWLAMWLSFGNTACFETLQFWGWPQTLYTPQCDQCCHCCSTGSEFCAFGLRVLQFCIMWSMLQLLPATPRRSHYDCWEPIHTVPQPEFSLHWCCRTQCMGCGEGRTSYQYWLFHC